MTFNPSTHARPDMEMILGGFVEKLSRNKHVRSINIEKVSMDVDYWSIRVKLFDDDHFVLTEKLQTVRLQVFESDVVNRLVKEFEDAIEKRRKENEEEIKDAH